MVFMMEFSLLLEVQITEVDFMGMCLCEILLGSGSILVRKHYSGAFSLAHNFFWLFHISDMRFLGWYLELFESRCLIYPLETPFQVFF
jgi:hypothetical protein